MEPIRQHKQHVGPKTVLSTPALATISNKKPARRKGITHTRRRRRLVQPFRHAIGVPSRPTARVGTSLAPLIRALPVGPKTLPKRLPEAMLVPLATALEEPASRGRVALTMPRRRHRCLKPKPTPLVARAMALACRPLPRLTRHSHMLPTPPRVRKLPRVTALIAPVPPTRVISLACGTTGLLPTPGNSPRNKSSSRLVGPPHVNPRHRGVLPKSGAETEPLQMEHRLRATCAPKTRSQSCRVEGNV